MSDSSDKLNTFSRRQPVNRRQRPRKVQKVQEKKATVPHQQQRLSEGGTTLTRQKNGVSVSRSKSGLVMPTSVKPIPRQKGKVPPIQPSGTKIKTVRMERYGLPKASKRSRKTRLKPIARTLLYTLRLLIVGVGIGAIVGTALSVLDPANRVTPAVSKTSNPNQSQTQPTPNTPPSGNLYLSQEIIPLKTAVQTLAAANPHLMPGIFLVDLDTGSYVDINGAASFPAASTIKIPILVAFFQDVDAGKIRLDEMLTMQQEAIAGGSGNMQFKPVGTQYTALEVATKMITISDNTATNMLISKLGGMEALNQRFRSWGLTTTAIRNQLPDLQGTNTTSPRELAQLMAIVNQGTLVNMRSRDRLLDIMRQTQRDNLLPSGLGAGASIAHKTGDIGTMLADTGLVDIPTGKRYIASVMVQRPNNDPRAEKLISAISQATYQQFSQNAVTPNNPASTIPANGYQSPVVTPPISNIPGNTTPTNGYQSPVMAPLPNNPGNTMPQNGYQSPVINPQYYPPR
ncbi:serine hydrolase [Calothrix sp. PCC 7507]|uniref:serine hydrolase n=1 Tax=Calothrix sp. PCC 7507 TaxID=99598 RepID=UPI0005A63967|nr:serine hydrolase [Calothrix sp. PCC 7507]